ncbi:hypothetical protein TREMEDRAFT_62331 [Tremella mesenterica DSM 1558]|uniref:uncharacterized protein n=1 Tax=Tremella mesenterica (strain ATCC 24925 / CBS 8224 / DSM 1558 / NBRC 9311 / NRRL Y-6157 / RJB 2259-6 / UBC 559-6) TaxID=578456 RepID=UPI0003F49763|nr:uncharacterized protein TREMEDRAFT_62331 [Tremella mesenterica DSM 1558]EIW69467.1 hypothetical protein TREMEDRAFT_62331 [Tremella mesenterica DSM 1558]
MFQIDLPPVMYGCALGNPGSCCCSSVAFALFEACLLCQRNMTILSKAETLNTFLDGCSNPLMGDVPAIVKAAGTFTMPPWAFMTQDPASTWTILSPVATTTRTTTVKTKITNGNGPTVTVQQMRTFSMSDSITASPTSLPLISSTNSTVITPAPDSSPPQRISTGAITGAVIGTSAGLVALSGLLVVIYRNGGRLRRRTSPISSLRRRQYIETAI